jgi:hypothetical protein
MPAQTIEDGLRYSKSNAMISARTGGLGVSYMGITDDYASVYYNPAGMTLINRSEFNVGFGFQVNATEGDYYGQKGNYASGDGYLSNIGFVTPLNTSGKKSAFGVGHFYENNFKSIFGVEDANHSKSFIDFEAKNGESPTSNYPNWTYELYLSEKSADGLSYNTEYNGDNSMKEYVSHNGGIHNIVGAYATDLTDVVSMGFSMTVKYGTFEYFREYIETPNSMNYTPVEGRTLDRLTITDYYNSHPIGITGKIGFQAKAGNHFRFGMAIELPTFYSFEEEYGSTYEAKFNEGGRVTWSPYKDFPTDTSFYEYSMITPFVYSAGASFNMAGVTVTAGMEFSDPGQLKFLDGGSELSDLNRAVSEELQPQIKWGAGAEWQIPVAPVSIRASVESATTPYFNNSDYDLPSYEYMSFSGGASFYFGKSVRFDIAGRYTAREDYVNLWSNPDANIYNGYYTKQIPFNVTFGLTYRF